MQCKYCKAELAEDSNICPNCGEENKKKDFALRLKIMMALVFSLLGLILVGVLLGAVNFGLTGRILPGKNDIYYKASYTVTEQTLDTKIGMKNFMNSRDTVVATMGEKTLTNRMLQVYYWDTVSNSDYADLDSKTDLDKRYQDPESKKTWQQFFIEKAIESWKRDTIVRDMANEDQFAMPEVYASQFETLEEDILTSAVSNNYATVDAFLESIAGCGTNFETYYNYLWTYFLGGTYWAEYIKEVEVDMTEIEAYYNDHKSELILDDYFQVTKDSGNLVDVRHILIQPKGGTKSEDGKTVTYSEEEWNACRDEAQAILDAWLAGERTEDSFSQLAKEKTADGGSKSNGGLYTNTWKGKMVQEFEDWCFDETRKTGDYGLVRTDYGYHIMYFVDAEEGWIRLCTSGAQSKKASLMMDEIAEGMHVDVNYKKIALADVN